MQFGYLFIGQAPADEPRSLLGKDPLYAENSQFECRVFKRMIERLFLRSDDSFVLILTRSRSSPDGNTNQLCIAFDKDDERAKKYVQTVQTALPRRWDEMARYELDWYRNKAKLLSQLSLDAMTCQDIPEEYRDINPPTRSFAHLSKVVKRAQLFAVTMPAVSTVH